jgi:uncharacterized protein (DUF2237 family)
MNIFGNPLQSCSVNPLTGFRRNGFCDLDEQDHGTHTVCAILTEPFLQFTRSRGNNLRGLRAGDKWCLCALRWLEAYEAGVAPFVIGDATHFGSLQYIPREIIVKYLLDI